MHSLSLGPVALPLPPVLLLLAYLLASVLVSYLLRRGGAAAQAAEARDTLLTGLLVGLVAARLVHLALHAPAYTASPWSVVDIRDGGWHAMSGLVAGLGWLAWRASRHAVWRRPMAIGSLVAVALWSAARLGLTTIADAPMPDIALLSLRPPTVASSLVKEARGRPVVVNLWASWCGPCRQEMPLLAQAQQRTRDVGFLFINQGETPQAVQAYLTDARLSLDEVWLDPSAKLGPAVGSRGLPTTLFYDRQGRLVNVHFGVLNAPALQIQLQALRGQDG